MQEAACDPVHDIFCFTCAGKEGWETGGQSDPTMELIRNYSMMVQGRTDQKHFKLSAMPCLGVVVVGDTLKYALFKLVFALCSRIGHHIESVCSC